MPVLINIDVSGSTKLVERDGEETAYRKIVATLLLIKETLRLADPTIHQDQADAGDGSLLFATDPIEIYRAASKYQAEYRDWPYEIEPIKITLGYGNVESVVDSGFKTTRGRKLHELYRVSAKCPKARIVVTSDFYDIMKKARYHHRFIPLRAELDGFEGIRTYYLSRWEYGDDEDNAPPSEQTSNRQRVRDGDSHKPFFSMTKVEAIGAAWLIFLTGAVVSFLVFIK